MKKKFVRWVSAAITVSMLLGLTACGSGDSSSSEGESSDESASEVSDEAKTPYSDGPQEISDIVADLVKDYDLPELSDEDKDYTINLGYYNCDHMAAASVGEYTGIYEALGLKVEVTGNGNVPEAMSAGQMDVAYCGWTTTLTAVQNDVPLFIAAENHIGGSEYLVVSNDIEDPEELIGKKVSIGTDPETTNLNWAEWSRQLGIPLDSSEYDAYDMSDSDEYLALVSGDLDAYICCDPWGSMAEYSGAGHIMVRQDTDRESGHGTCCKVAMNYNFAKAHPELAQRILLAHTICLQFMYEHPYYAAEIFSAYYNVPTEVAMMTFWRKFVDEGRTIRWDLNTDYMKNQLATMKELGVRDDINSVNVLDYVDTSYFDACGAKNFTEFIETNIDPVFPEGMDYESFKAKALAIDGIDPDDIPEYAELDR